MNKAFDIDLYLKIQREEIMKRIDKFGDKLYLEFGGKLFDDFHASRVLPGFNPDTKLKMLLGLKDKVEIVIVVNSADIQNNKIREDLGITYEAEVLRLIEAYQEANIFVAVTGAFHNLGILQCFAIYLFNEHGINYTDFYLSLIKQFKNNPDSVGGKICSDLYKKLEDVTKNLGSCETLLPEFGNVNWPVEEGFFLQIIKDFDLFFDEITAFLGSFGIEKDIFNNLIVYQKKMIKRPSVREFSFSVAYDFPEYFQNIYNGCPDKLNKTALTVCVNDQKARDSYPDYARETVWYGRKGGRIMYKEEMNIIVDTTK